MNHDKIIRFNLKTRSDFQPKLSMKSTRNYGMTDYDDCVQPFSYAYRASNGMMQSSISEDGITNKGKYFRNSVIPDDVALEVACYY